jgi:LacI family transcriptional regulator
VEERIEGASIPSVSVDNRLVGYEAARHLLALGHRRIAHITGNYYFRSARLRHQGFMEAMAEAGVEVPDGDVIYADFKFSSGYSGMNMFMGMSKRPTAVFAANDDMAYGALRCAQDLGIQVPEEVSIMGVDGNKVYDEDRDLLTTVKQPTEAFGEWAVSSIVSMLKGGKPDPLHLTLGFEIIPGLTSAPPPRA